MIAGKEYTNSSGSYGFLTIPPSIVDNHKINVNTS